MSRRRKSHHGKIDISGLVLLAVGLAGAALAYRDRLIFAVGAGVVIGSLIGFVAGSRMRANTVNYYADTSPEPFQQQIRKPRPREFERPAEHRKRGAISGRMISLSPECMGREDCLRCNGVGCDCPCGHDAAAIVAWNAARYDEEHEPEYDPANILAEDDEDIPF